MALVGDISGSSQSNSTIGITGSVIVANCPDTTFPTFPGQDVSFYVSGSTDGNDKSLFGGDLVVSGSFTVEGSILEITGTLEVTDGISGSLTKLTDGTSYLIAGTGISITSQSNGPVTISFAGDDFFDSTTAGSIFTTGSAAFVGSESVDSPSDKGTDVFFYVSGSIDAKNGATPGVALFGGDVVVSGSFFGEGSRLELTGTLEVTDGISGSLTKLTDGTSYLIAGNDIQIVSSSNGPITISFAGDDFFDSTTAGSIFTTGSVALRGADTLDSPTDKGSDVFFYVSGSKESTNGATPGVALFGGDIVVSGSITCQGDALEVSGSVSVSGSYSGNTSTLTGPGTIASSGHGILLTSTGAADAITLSDGSAPGQLKYVVANSGYTGGNTSIITPTNAIGYTTVTFDANGDTATFFWTGSKWAVVGYYGASVT